MAAVNVSLQVIPCVPENQIYPVVDKVIDLIAKSGVKYEVGPMETTMEGDIDTLLEIVKKRRKYVFRKVQAGFCPWLKSIIKRKA